jgi:hypothetical protein
MTSLSAARRTCIPRYQWRLRKLVLRGFCLLAGSVAACACVAVGATSVSDQQRFQLTGSGVLQLDAPLQKSGNVQLRGRLVPDDATFAASPPAQEGGVFALKASLAAASMICYNDTIFRDDFDADGF